MQRRRTIQAVVGEVRLTLETDPSLFSPRRPDPGTLALLSMVEFAEDDRVLDLGCGYGLIGIYAARRIGADNVILADIDPLAVRLAKRNAANNNCAGLTAIVSNGFQDLSESRFTKILCNPPYHSDFSTPKHFIEKGFNRLVPGGKMWFVTKRERWYAKKFTGIFGGVRVHKCNQYCVFEAAKKSHTYSRSKTEERRKLLSDA